ncbi:MAG: hypothetical protein AB7O24_03615 [Kofleriaceae bacterium]
MASPRLEKLVRALAPALAKLLPAAHVVGDGEQLTVDGRAIAIDEYLAPYEDASWLGRGAVVRRAAATIAHQLTSDPVFEDYATARDVLRARITTDAAMDLLRLTYLAQPGSSSRPVSRAIAADLVIEPIIDRDDHIVRIHRSMLDQWEVDDTTVLDDASAAMISGEISFTEVVGVQACGAAEALFPIGAILDLALQDVPHSALEARAEWAASFAFPADRARVMVPHPEVLFVFDHNDAKAWSAAAVFALSCAIEGDALSSAVLTRTGGTWVEIAPPRSLESAVRDALADATRAIRVKRYEDQGRHIASAYPELDPAPVTQQGAQLLATVTRGRSAALAVVDRVAFVDPRSSAPPHVVDWHQLTAMRGISLEPFAGAPPRVMLIGWPEQ